MLVPSLCQAPAIGGIFDAQSPGLRALVMFIDAGDQAERQFWIDLEFRVRRELDNQPVWRRLGLMCDGFTPKRYYLLEGVPSRITGVVSMMGTRHLEKWKFSLIFPFSASGRADITSSGLLPASEANGWLVITTEKKEMEVRLGQ
jgi:hypothetical protein